MSILFLRQQELLDPLKKLIRASLWERFPIDRLSNGFPQLLYAPALHSTRFKVPIKAKLLLKRIDTYPTDTNTPPIDTCRDQKLLLPGYRTSLNAFRLLQCPVP